MQQKVNMSKKKFELIGSYIFYPEIQTKIFVAKGRFCWSTLYSSCTKEVHRHTKGIQLTEIVRHHFTIILTKVKDIKHTSLNADTKNYDKK